MDTYVFMSEIKTEDGWRLMNPKMGGGQCFTYVDNSPNSSVAKFFREHGKIVSDYSVEYGTACLTDEDGNVIEDYSGNVYALTYWDIKKLMCEEKKHCGYVPDDEIDDFEKGEGPIITCLSTAEYMALENKEMKEHFSWYSYYDDDSPIGTLSAILEHHKWLIYDYEDAYFLDNTSDGDTRILINID